MHFSKQQTHSKWSMSVYIAMLCSSGAQCSVAVVTAQSHVVFTGIPVTSALIVDLRDVAVIAHVLLPVKKISTTPVCILGYEIANLGQSAQKRSEHHVYVAEAWRACGIIASIAEWSIWIHISETQALTFDATPLAFQSHVAPLVVTIHATVAVLCSSSFFPPLVGVICCDAPLRKHVAAL